MVYPFPVFEESTLGIELMQKKMITDYLLGKEQMDNDSNWTQSDMGCFLTLYARVLYERLKYKRDIKFTFTSADADPLPESEGTELGIDPVQFADATENGMPDLAAIEESIAGAMTQGV